MGVGTFLGNIIGAIIILALSISAFFAPAGSSVGFLIVMYCSWLFVVGTHLLTMPKKTFDFFMELSHDEVQTYKMFHLAIWFPGGAAIYSAILNIFRFVGIIWGGICLWNGLYYIGCGMIAFYFLSSGMIMKTNPYLYLSEGVKSGDSFVLKESMRFEFVIKKWEHFREANRDK